MCLFLKKNVPDEETFKTAEEDLTFYKVLRVFKNAEGNDGYVTPYRCMYIKLGKLYQEIGSDYFVTKPGVPEPEYDRRIFGGGFHLFRDYVDAVDFSGIFPDSRVVKAVVPKGTRYAVGDYKLCRFGRAYKSAVAKGVIYYELPKEEL